MSVMRAVATENGRGRVGGAGEGMGDARVTGGWASGEHRLHEQERWGEHKRRAQVAIRRDGSAAL